MEHKPYAQFYVCFLGRFSLRFEDKEIVITKPLKQKRIQLLLLLLKAGDKGITRRKLAEMLEGEIKGWENQLNNLRQHVFALRRMLKKLENMPEDDYVVISPSGTYYFNRKVSIESDINQVDQLDQKLNHVTDTNKRLKILKKLCGYYQGGGFLPALSGEEWALIEEARYQAIFSQRMKELCDILKEMGEYTELLEFSTLASQLYPYDEWQAIQIDCLMAKGRYKEAMKLYESVNDELYKDLGIPLHGYETSEYNSFRERLGLISPMMTEIQNKLEEGSPEHRAYYCSYPAFVDIYRVIVRLFERNGSSAYLMVCTLKGGDHSHSDGAEYMETQMEQFQKLLEMSIRSSDTYTRYSLNQFLVLLIGIEEKTGSEVAERLKELWKSSEKEGRASLEILSENVLDTALKSQTEVSENGEEKYIYCSCRGSEKCYLAGNRILG